MRHRLRISGLPGFGGRLLPFHGFEEISDRLLRELELVEIEIPGGIMQRDRKQFTPIQEAYYQASQHIDRKEWAAGLKGLRKVIELKPDPVFLAAIHTMMGMIHARIRNQEAAIKEFREALELNPTAEYAHLFLGTALMLSNRFEEAIDPIIKALELDPKLSHGSLYLGYIYTKLERWQDAIAAYERQIETEPGSRQAYQELARLYFKLGDQNASEQEHYYKRAIETFTKWVERDPQDSDTLNLIGYLSMMIDRRDYAIEAFEKAVRVSPKHVLALFNLGAAYLEADRNEDARTVFQHILDFGEQNIRKQLEGVSPNLDAAIRLSLGEAHQKLGAANLKMYQSQVGSGKNITVLREAETAFKTSLKHVPSDVQSLYNLAITHYLMGYRAAAMRDFRDVLEIEPNNEDAANNMRAVEEDLGKVRHWLGSKVWKRLESATDESPIFSQDIIDEIAKARARIYDNIDTSHEAEAFTSDDLLQALLPIVKQIPSAEAIADLTVGLLLKGWLTTVQAAQLAGTDLAAFLAYSYLAGVPFDELATNTNGDQRDSLIEALKEVLQLQPDDDRARKELRALLLDSLDQKLQQSGLLKEVRQPITDFTPYRNRTLLPAGHKPLSELVVEDRR